MVRTVIFRKAGGTRSVPATKRAGSETVPRSVLRRAMGVLGEPSPRVRWETYGTSFATLLPKCGADSVTPRRYLVEQTEEIMTSTKSFALAAVGALAFTLGVHNTCDAFPR